MVSAEENEEENEGQTTSSLRPGPCVLSSDAHYNGYVLVGVSGLGEFPHLRLTRRFERTEIDPFYSECAEDQWLVSRAGHSQIAKTRSRCEKNFGPKSRFIFKPLIISGKHKFSFKKFACCEIVGFNVEARLYCKRQCCICNDVIVSFK